MPIGVWEEKCFWHKQTFVVVLVLVLVLYTVRIGYVY